MIFNDLEWLSKIFNDTKHRATSLRQLSFLSSTILYPEESATTFYAENNDVAFTAAALCH